MSLDNFYAMVTGDEDAFYKMCMVLPGVIKEVVESQDDIKAPNDTVLEELRTWAGHLDAEVQNEDLSLMMAVYMLGFNGYLGFY